MAPLDTHLPDWEARLAEIDVLLDRNRAAVAAMGYEPPPRLTKEAVEAEMAELDLALREPMGTGLGVPQEEWRDSEGNLVMTADDHKWKAWRNGHRGDLRKNMGLQASKPRNYDKSSKYAAKVKEESSDEEEGRSGLGKAKKRKHNGASGNSAHADTSKESVDTTMTDVKIKEELGRRAAKDPENTEKVLTWNMKTALASTAPPEEGQGSLLTSIEQDFIEAPEPEDSLSQDHMLRISVRDMFKLQNPEQSQKQLKLVYYKEDPTDNARDGGEMVGDDDSLKSEEEDIAKDMEATKQESPPVPPRSVRRLKRSRSRNESSCFPESGVSKVTKDEGLTVRGEMNAAAGITKSKPESKKRKMNHDDEQIKEEEGIKLEASEHADAEALAKERQLARQRAREALGSGTSSSKPKPKSKKHAKKLEKKQEGKPTKKLKMKDMMMNASNE